MTNNMQLNIIGGSGPLSEELGKLYREIGIYKLPEEIQEFVMEELGVETLNRILEKMNNDLPTDQIQAFTDFVKTGANENSILTYLSIVYPQAGEIILNTGNEVLRNFKERMAAV